MTSRRAVLAGLGTVGVAGLAGCSSLPIGEESDQPEDVSLPADAVEPVARPESPFPVAVPPSLAEAHRERARTLLEEVPTEPTVPNAAVTEELRADREGAAARLSDDVEADWPTRRLSRWRGRRNAAANAWGAHRAATGEDDAATVVERRARARSELGSFVADHAYLASSPLEAVVAHAPIEELVADCRRRTRPQPGYPADPVARPFRAGEAVGRVELARATLADARGLRETFVSERADASSQWAALIDTSDRLRLSVHRTRSPLREFLDVEEPPFEADLEGTAGRSLFRSATRIPRARADDFEDRLDDGAFATAIIRAGQLLAGLATLEATIEAIRDGEYQEDVTVESVDEAEERAREAITAVAGTEHPRLATHIVRPVLSSFNSIPNRIEEGYADAPRVQGELAWCELYARAVPSAAAFVFERLE